MSFWKNLFGGGGDDPKVGTGKGAPEESYKDFTIRATLLPAGSEFQLAGTIEKTIDGEIKRHDFIRADKFSAKDEAIAFTFAKGRQLIDEQGDRIFS